MKIVEQYSHLNGLEYLLVHHKALWKEICAVVGAVDAASCRTKVSREKTKRGKVLFSPIDMNRAFSRELSKRDWHESRVSYWVTRNAGLIRQTLNMSAQEQKAEIEAAGAMSPNIVDNAPHVPLSADA